ncbi:hypothetical protein GLGR_0938 [Leminorella grimontii ATCC 33999 = DSM 5078]|nr:hypothetical protein GLGR_0938 [Leminorella grimontii ATCC 33999 = DSM 5078]
MNELSSASDKRSRRYNVKPPLYSIATPLINVFYSLIFFLIFSFSA